MLAPGVGFDYVSRMELGVYTFAETTPDPATGKTIGTAQRLRDLLEEIELADQVGLDVYGIGEHHREDFSAAAPPMILSAAAARTKSPIHLRCTCGFLIPSRHIVCPKLQTTAIRSAVERWNQTGNQHTI